MLPRLRWRFRWPRRVPWRMVSAIGGLVVFVAACRLGFLPFGLSDAETGTLVAAPVEHRPVAVPPVPLPVELPTAPLKVLTTPPAAEATPTIVSSLPTTPEPTTSEREEPAAPQSPGPETTTLTVPRPVDPALWSKLVGEQRPRAVAVVFLAADCPVSIGTLPHLTRLQATWKELGVQFVGVLVGPDVTQEWADRFRYEHRIHFPLRIDSTGTLTEWLQPTHTPEVFVFSAVGELAYRGRIDDRFLPPEQQPSGYLRNYLDDALAAVVDGSPVRIRQSQPVGCPVGKDQ